MPDFSADQIIRVIAALERTSYLIVAVFFVWAAGDKIAAIIRALAMFLPWNKGK